MKKKIFKTLCLVLAVAFILTGCGNLVVSDVKNESKELLYCGGSVVKVGNNLFFANAYSPVGDSDTDYTYSTYAKTSYLNMINTDTIDAEQTFFSPKGLEKRNTKVVGFENQYMFVLGNYIYFTSPNTHKTDKLVNSYSLLTFFRSRLDGGDKSPKEFFTTENAFSENGKITTMKDSAGNYYLIVYDGSELSTFKLGDNLGKRKVVKDVQSIAVPSENDEYSVNALFYTTTRKDSEGNLTSYIDVFSYDYSTGESTLCSQTKADADIKLLDREGDIVFYTNSAVIGGSRACYYEDVSQGISFNGENKFYPATQISDANFVCPGDPENEGFIFVNGNNSSIMYQRKVEGETQTETLVSSSDYTDFLFVDSNAYVYYAKETGIYRISVKDRLAETVVEMPKIISSNISCDGEYIYFYSQLKFDQPDIEGEEKIEYETDENYYMYRVKMDKEGEYQVLSKFSLVEKKEED